MPDSDPRDGFFYLSLTPAIDLLSFSEGGKQFDRVTISHIVSIPLKRRFNGECLLWFQYTIIGTR